MRGAPAELVRLEPPESGGLGYRARLIAGALAPLLVAMLCQAVYTLRSDRELSTRGLHDKATALSNLLVQLVGPSLALDDGEGAHESLGYVTSDPDFQFAMVIDPKNQLLAYRGAEALRPVALAHANHVGHPQVVETAEHLIARHPIRSGVELAGDDLLGTVVVALGTAPARAKAATMTLHSSLLLGAGVLAAVLVVVVLTGRVEQRNRETRLLLSNVEQGFLSMSRSGVLAAERSAAATRLVGTYKPGQTLWEALDPIDPDAAAWIEVSWATIRDGLLPLDVALGQLPKQLSFGPRTYRLGLIPARQGARLDEILIVLTDITDELARARAEAAERDLARLIEKIANDLSGFLEFFSDSGAFVTRLAARDAAGEVEPLMRDLHTLKGNCSVFGLLQVAELCHVAEDKLAAGGIEYASQAIDELVATWRAVEVRFQRFAASVDPTLGAIELDDLADLLAAIGRGVPTRELQDLVSSWHHERLETRFQRFGEQLRTLAQRAGKGEVDVTIETHDLRVPGSVWRPFWLTVPHLLRNIVDHGLELSSEREAANKPARALVKLHADVECDELRIVIEDDGRGIDWERIAARARAAGLPAVTHEDLVAALFHDGVTTRDEASELSGRGVGLAAVRVACRDLHGTIRVDSTPGQGARFEFRFPSPTTMRSAA